MPETGVLPIDLLVVPIAPETPDDQLVGADTAGSLLLDASLPVCEGDIPLWVSVAAQDG